MDPFLANSMNSFGTQPYKVNKQSWKIKYNNRVKKLATLPDTFEDLDKLIRKKYDEFKEGKDTYQLCYIDQENDEVDISDEEDYEVFLKKLWKYILWTLSKDIFE